MHQEAEVQAGIYLSAQHHARTWAQFPAPLGAGERVYTPQNVQWASDFIFPGYLLCPRSNRRHCGFKNVSARSRCWNTHASDWITQNQWEYLLMSYKLTYQDKHKQIQYLLRACSSWMKTSVHMVEGAGLFSYRPPIEWCEYHS